LKQLKKCTQEHSSAHPDLGYPASIALLGSSGTNCIDGKLIAQGGCHYKFTYTPGLKGAEGRVETYVITASPVEYGRSGDSSYFSDETGKVHYTREDRPATANDPPPPR
jgi:hypothetical protein